MPFTRAFINIQFNTNWVLEFMEDLEHKFIGSDDDLNIYVEEWGAALQILNYVLMNGCLITMIMWSILITLLNQVKMITKKS